MKCRYIRCSMHVFFHAVFLVVVIVGLVAFLQSMFSSFFSLSSCIQPYKCSLFCCFGRSTELFFWCSRKEASRFTLIQEFSGLARLNTGACGERCIEKVAGAYSWCDRVRDTNFFFEIFCVVRYVSTVCIHVSVARRLMFAHNNIQLSSFVQSFGHF